MQAAIRESVAKLGKEATLNRYQGRMVGTKTVAEIHGVQSQLVIKYANLGQIRHVRDGNLMKFDLKDVLQLDFTELRKSMRKRRSYEESI